MLLHNKDVVEKLKKEGLVFRDLILRTEGDWDVADADWNYRDLIHLGPVHATGCTILSTYPDSTGQILWPSMFGIRLPMQILSYKPAPNKHSAVSIWMCFAMTSEDVFVPIGPNRTRVVTHYKVGAPKIFAFMLPIITWLLKRSYKKLMSEDIPMRARRGQLRRWGFRFKYDNQYTFTRGSTIAEDEVLPPEEAMEAFAPMKVNDLVEDGGEHFLGKSDHLGLRIHRNGKKIYFYPRICNHAGASLDESSCQAKQVKCPWHSKVFQPLGSFQLSDSKRQSFSTRYHNVVMESGTLFVSIKPKMRRTKTSPAPLEASA